MKNNKKERHLSSYVQVALYKEDLEKLKQATENSTSRTLSDYCRKLLLGDPLTVYYRNQSFDVFMEEAIALRKEMEMVRQKIPFTIDDEQRLLLLQEEIKLCINKIFDHVCENTSE